MIEFLKQNGPRLKIGGIDFEDLTRTYGTPLYVYDAEIVREKYRRLRSAMPEFVHIFYAVKSNPNREVVRILAELGAGFDIASIGELSLLKSMNIEPTRIVFTGPGKSDIEVEEAIRYGIYSFNVESKSELVRVNACAGMCGKIVNVGLRIHTDYAIQETTSIIGGERVKKFGIDEHQLPDVIRFANTLKNVKIIGAHIFNATQILDYKALADNTENICDVIARSGFGELEYLDIGGGLGIPYREGELELDVDALGRAFREINRKSSARASRWILEPGRYLSGECGVLLSCVTDVKTTRDCHFAITDAGVNQFLRPVLIGMNHATRVANKWNAPAEKKYRVEGPLCTSIDCIAKDVLLPEVGVGDTIAILNAGAYGYTEAMPFFLSHACPAEVVVDQGKAILARRRVEPEEYLDFFYNKK